LAVKIGKKPEILSNRFEQPGQPHQNPEIA